MQRSRIGTNLSEHRFIDLIVPEFTVADEVDNDIGAEPKSNFVSDLNYDSAQMLLLPPCRCQVVDPNNRLRIISVHVKNWSIEGFRDIAAISGRARPGAATFDKRDHGKKTLGLT